jgi:hypothetical protein
VLRPRVVSDYQSARVSSERAKWRLFGIATWVLTAAAGAWVALSSFPGLPGSGEHALSPLQRVVAGAADAVAGAAAPQRRRRGSLPFSSPYVPFPAGPHDIGLLCNDLMQFQQ